MSFCVIPCCLSYRVLRGAARRWGALLCGVVLLWSGSVSIASAQREVVVGLYENDPKLFTDAAGQPAGIFPELLAEIATREGWLVRHVSCEWAACLEMLDAGQIDLMPDVAFSAERAQRFTFHDSPVLHSWSQVFKPLDSRVESILDLDGQRVAMLGGSLQEDALRAMLAGFDVSFEIVAADSLPQAFALVAQGAADVAVANHLFAVRHAPGYGLAPAPVVFQPVRLFFATASGQNLDLLESIDRQLLLLKADESSVYYRILTKWGAPAPELIVPVRLQRLLLALFAGGVALAAMAVLLRFQVRARTAEAVQLAHFDQLTGLPNRVLLRDRFVQLKALAQRHQQTFAVMFLDLDHFKNINDTLGHDAGDLLLVAVARRLETGLRAGDTVCRQGGDEFIILLAECEAESVPAVARKLIAAVSAPCRIREHELVTTPSIGIAMFPQDGDDLDTLLRKADVAMYRVKHDSRGDYRFYTNEMQAHSERALLLASALRQAATAGQLSLHYQPQFDVVSRTLTGVEALVRWTHPALGSLSPTEFIPVAESTGLINQLGAWVLQEAARHFRQWQDEGIAPTTLAVNLSAVQFRRDDLVATIRDALDSAGVQPERFELELTEAVAMDDAENALRMMRRLVASGVRIAIDDFGTGYSSLSYLKRFTAHRLKIDQSFVRDIHVDADDRAIVRAIIRLAHSLDLRTVAEGVETELQLDFLVAEGCDEAQGYLFARPMPAGEMGAFLRAHCATSSARHPDDQGSLS